MNSLAIWVTEQSPGNKARVLRVVSPGEPGDFIVQWDEFNPHVHDGQLAPTLVLPVEMAEALVKELADYLPPSSAQGEHLKDAIKVRNELMGLVVSLTSSRWSVGPDEKLKPWTPGDPA